MAHVKTATIWDVGVSSFSSQYGVVSSMLGRLLYTIDNRLYNIGDRY